jgi:hypothetical protein
MVLYQFENLLSNIPETYQSLCRAPHHPRARLAGMLPPASAEAPAARPQRITITLDDDQMDKLGRVIAEQRLPEQRGSDPRFHPCRHGASHAKEGEIRQSHCSMDSTTTPRETDVRLDLIRAICSWPKPIDRNTKRSVTHRRTSTRAPSDRCRIYAASSIRSLW